MTNEEYLRRAFRCAGMTREGAAALLGNLQAESALNPANLQNTYEKKLGMSDEAYTRAVDEGTYRDFETDRAGYGLAQWTSACRKRRLLEYIRGTGASVGDLSLQTAYILMELRSDYPAVWRTLISSHDLKACSDLILTRYERPADRGSAAKAKREAYAREFLERDTEGENAPVLTREQLEKVRERISAALDTLAAEKADA